MHDNIMYVCMEAKRYARIPFRISRDPEIEN